VVKNFISLRKMQVVGWLYLIVLVIGSWVFFSWNLAWSILVGGMIAIASFWVSQRELSTFLNTLGAGPALSEGQAKVHFSKSGFLLKFWIRIAIIGVVVLLLIKYSSINAFGLILGLSTIVFTVTFTAVEIVRRYYFSGRR
jgi:hypothetical protein